MRNRASSTDSMDSFTSSSSARSMDLTDSNNSTHSIPDDDDRVFSGDYAHVVGTGGAGIGTAKELSKQGYKIDLYEMLDTPANSTSSGMAGRLAIGHYDNTETATHIIETQNIPFIKAYPEFIETENVGTIYNFMENSPAFKSVEDFEKSYVEKIKAFYKALVDKDPSNAVFGKPEELFVRIPLGEQNTVMAPADPEHPEDPKRAPKKVLARYWVKEKFIAWAKLKKHLIEEITQDSNITLHLNTRVIACEKELVAKSDDQLTVKTKYTVTTQDMKQPADAKHQQKQVASVYADCSSFDIERLKQSFAHTAKWDDAHPTRTNRVKVMLEVELPTDFRIPYLPPAFASKFYSILYSYGAYAGITITGRNEQTGRLRALVSYEPGTNVQDNRKLELEALSFRLLSHTATEEETKACINKIQAGAACYFPGLEKAEPICLKAGNVRSESPDPTNIYSSVSPHHQRVDDGIRSEGLNLFGVPLVKFGALAYVREKIANLFRSHQSANQQINKAFRKSKLAKDKRAALLAYKHIDTHLLHDLPAFSTKEQKTTPKTEKIRGKVQEAALKSLLTSVTAKADVVSDISTARSKLRHTKNEENTKKQEWWKTLYREELASKSAFKSSTAVSPEAPPVTMPSFKKMTTAAILLDLTPFNGEPDSPDSSNGASMKNYRKADIGRASPPPSCTLDIITRTLSSHRGGLLTKHAPPPNDNRPPLTPCVMEIIDRTLGGSLPIITVGAG